MNENNELSFKELSSYTTNLQGYNTKIYTNNQLLQASIGTTGFSDYSHNRVKTYISFLDVFEMLMVEVKITDRNNKITHYGFDDEIKEVEILFTGNYELDSLIKAVELFHDKLKTYKKEEGNGNE